MGWFSSDRYEITMTERGRGLFVFEWFFVFFPPCLLSFVFFLSGRISSENEVRNSGTQRTSSIKKA